MCTPRKSNPRELKVDNIMSLEVGRCTSRSRALRIIRRMSEALSFLFASFLYSIHSPLKEVKSKKKKKKKKKINVGPLFSQQLLCNPNQKIYKLGGQFDHPRNRIGGGSATSKS
jgi:hypothetical protein